MPIIAGPLAVACAAMVTGRRVTAIGAAITALWIAGTFYYWFGLPLTTKAAILVALGLAIAAAVWLEGGDIVPAGDLGASSAAPVSWNTALIGLALAAAVGVVGLLAAERREVVATGRTVFVELAPIDPRSLIQGDYMALQFRLPRVRIEGGAGNRVEPLTGLATIDARGIATVARIVASPGERKPGEHVVRLTHKGGRLILGTDAFHFKEGTAARYAKARYGMFRLAPDGRAVLIGLADDDLRPLD